jgi:hypothetical protein
MKDLNSDLSNKIHDLVTSPNKNYASLQRLVNDVVTADTDYEHLITFLADSPSEIHRRFARDLRTAFENVLRDRLSLVRNELGDGRFFLYATLLDMYNVDGWSEDLHAILTINYDTYLEAAATAVQDAPIDFGVTMQGQHQSNAAVTVLKLHGSLGWNDTWPIRVDAPHLDAAPLWIPPGIQKSKQRYPFNVPWGRARELLDCDVLRIVGCRLSGTDWDLVSLLFSTRHTHSRRSVPYTIEIIDTPALAQRLQQEFPYLDVRSLVNIDSMDIGDKMIGDLLGGPPRSFDSLSRDEKARLAKAEKSDRNWFHMWLQQMAEGVFLTVESIDTPSGMFRRFVETL